MKNFLSKKKLVNFECVEVFLKYGVVRRVRTSSYELLSYKKEVLNG